jgi:predicted aldo/keto reductase-like oxidoreductase
MMAKDNISRRDFLKLFGIGAATATATMIGCSPNAQEDGNSNQAGNHTGEPPKDKMTYRINPTTKDRVSLLGYGCMRFPTKTDVYGKEVINQDIVNQLVDYAIEHGVNFFDTSPRYIQGMSEAATGAALSRHPREKYFVSTKLSNQSPEHWRKEKSIEMYHQSFKNLQVDVIDYYLLHSIGGAGMDILKGRYLDNGVLDFLLEERKKGKIRNLGFSYHGDIEPFNYLLANHDKYQWDFALIQLNYIDWKHAAKPLNTNAEYLYGELEKRNIPALVMEPLLGGRLASLPYHLFRQLKTRRPDASAAEWAFRYAGSQKGVLSVLSGMIYMEHLKDNLRTYSPLQYVDNEELALLEDIATQYIKYPLVDCTDCQYCMPCPYGINIPGVFSFYNKMVNDGFVPKNLQDKNYRKLRRNFLIEYSRRLQLERQANHCTGCEICLDRCPQRIQIPNQLNRINNFVENLKQEKQFEIENNAPIY